jgi:hypothetical protein
MIVREIKKLQFDKYEQDNAGIFRAAIVERTAIGTSRERDRRFVAEPNVSCREEGIRFIWLE